jgi:hypothetical protein
VISVYATGERRKEGEGRRGGGRREEGGGRREEEGGRILPVHPKK